ncbi:hypothetical protein, partial [Pseudomonas aeruginosa]|uniref:hypothetical protein n=1 Tax=Pseudomonas aeruginosa TaxID=287 RepID=UPI0038926319
TESGSTNGRLHLRSKLSKEEFTFLSVLKASLENSSPYKSVDCQLSRTAPALSFGSSTNLSESSSIWSGLMNSFIFILLNALIAHTTSNSASVKTLRRAHDLATVSTA